MGRYVLEVDLKCGQRFSVFLAICVYIIYSEYIQPLSSPIWDFPKIRGPDADPQ